MGFPLGVELLPFFTFAMLGGGVLALAGGLQKARLWRLIRSTPTSPAGMVAPGPVEVCGTVEADGPLARAPFSGREAAYGRWSVLEKRRAGKGEKWVQVDGGVLGGPFRVRDGSGAVRVDPEGARLDLEQTWSESSGLGKDPPTHVVAFLRSRGRDFEGWFGINKAMRFHEEMLYPGQEVYVLGVASMDDGARTAIRKAGLRFPFLVSSRPEHGAMRRARSAALGLLLFAFILLGVGAFAATRLASA